MRIYEVGAEMDMPVTMDGRPFIKKGKCISINDRYARFEFDFDGYIIHESYLLNRRVITGRTVGWIRRTEDAETIEKAERMYE